MPISPRTSEPLREAVGRLRAACSDAWALDYIDHHAGRCIDDVLRLASLRPGARVLNVGGAPYIFEAAAEAAGLRVTTLDIDPSRHGAIIDAVGADVIEADFEQPDGRGAIDLATFDVICLCEVLEHFRIDLVATLSDIKKRKRPDAIVYLTTPNFFYAPRFLSALRQGRSGPSLVNEWRKLGELGHMGHVREYSRRELTELFEFTGFRAERVDCRNSQEARGLAKYLARAFDGFAQELVFYLT